ncbi:MAG: phosphate signaling complex protein PhoU [Tissierellia bacterium]|nr:phosphate signaling complex protein PhoU [Tissierellia bacterium]
MRYEIDRELDTLNEQLIAMGKEVKKTINDAIISLENNEKDFAKKIIENDDEIDNMERDLERKCLTLMIRQHPVASDLRLITAVLKMTTDLERIGDQAADIAEISLHFDELSFLRNATHIPKMAALTIDMVDKSLKAFVNGDLALADEVIKEDDKVDELFLIVRNELIDLIHKDKKLGEEAMDMLMVTKYLERIGDHAENIAYWVIYSITGSMPNGSNIKNI